MDAIRELMAQRDALEAEASSITEQLSASNMGGVSGALVDGEGFPRADVDVHGTRTLRNRLARLNTDHRQLMDQIEKAMHDLHTAAAASGTVTAGARAPTAPVPSAAAGPPPAAGHGPPAALNGHAVELKPFALVDAVHPDGPAASAGVQVGDRVLRFGSVHAENHDNLRALARLTQRSADAEVAVIVERGGAPVEIQLRPRAWAGQGLLGCHLNPL